MDFDPLPASQAPFIFPSLLANILCNASAGSPSITFHSPADWATWWLIVIIAILCLGVSAFVSGSEIAYFGLSRQDVEELEEAEDENPKAKSALSLLRDPERLLATILITNNLVNITMVVLLTFAINQAVRFHSSVVSFLVQTVFMTFLLLLCGEIFPKLVARGRARKWVLSSVAGVRFLYKLFRPISALMVRSTSLVNRIVTKRQENISTDELEKALEISDVKEGRDKDMLEGILTFGERDAREIMIPRVDVTHIEYHASWEEVMKIILDSGYSRIPVYDTKQDTIRGVLYSKDLLPYIGKDDRPRWQSLIREAYFVPESRMLDDLLEDFRKRKIHIAIVVDEYGDNQGIVTLEDIIEEIVGEIDDEYDEVDRMYRKIGPQSWIFEAKIQLVDFCRVVGIDEDELGDVGDAETLAGLLLEIKGDFPTLKEKLERGSLEFVVLGMEKHRITKVKVTLLETEDKS